MSSAKWRPFCLGLNVLTSHCCSLLLQTISHNKTTNLIDSWFSLDFNDIRNTYSRKYKDCVYRNLVQEELIKIKNIIQEVKI